MKAVNILFPAVLIALSFSLVPAAAPQVTGAPITWQEAMTREGQTVTVETMIVNVYDPESRGQGGPVRLNTDRDFRNSLNIIFHKKDRSGIDQGFGDPDRFRGKTVRVRGRVSKFRDQMQLTVSRPDQIEIVETALAPPTEQVISPARSRITGTAVTWQEAMKMEGQTVTVETRIVNVFDPESRGEGGPVRLNTDRDHRTSLNIIFHKKDRSGVDRGFGDPDQYQGKTVRVRGRVSAFRDQMQLTIPGPDQIEILD